MTTTMKITAGRRAARGVVRDGCRRSRRRPCACSGTIEKVDGNVADAEDRATARTKLTLTGNAHDRRRGEGLDGRHQGEHLPRQRGDAAAGRHARRRWRCTSSPRRCAAPARGIGRTHRPGSTMTNGTAAGATVTGVDGAAIKLKYKDGEKMIVVPPNVPIVRYEIGSAGRPQGRRGLHRAGRDQEAGRHAGGGAHQRRPRRRGAAVVRTSLGWDGLSGGAG